eukprot:TRINITY_DN769_c0_g1_i1.p1 TRINITY_DN769_c0_g1~~TRINITY_DN769_c0_g1_i1.p1  ORF type:complete len:280 (+),score=35.76 TRINITY_DN769_c0_g1_i1:206-1045(+)
MNRVNVRKRDVDFQKDMVKVSNNEDFMKFDSIDQSESGLTNLEKKELGFKAKKSSAELSHSKVNGVSQEGSAQKSTGEKSLSIASKQDIIIPLVQQIDENAQNGKKFEKPMKKKRPTIEYIRMLKKDLVPKQDIYDATDQDLVFLNELNQGVKQPVSIDAFERILANWDNHTGRGEVISYMKAQTVTSDNIPDQILNNLYKYWVDLRKQLKRPLIRKYWKCLPFDDTNPNIVFRPREKEKMKLRRSKTHVTDAYQKMKNLKQEMEMVRVMVQSLSLIHI